MPCDCHPQLEVLDKAACQAMNMGLYLGVAEASDEPPAFIHLTYTPTGRLGGFMGRVWSCYRQSSQLLGRRLDQKLRSLWPCLFVGGAGRACVRLPIP